MATVTTNPAIAGMAQLRQIATGLRPTDVASTITLISPEETTMTTVLSSTGRIRKDDIEFKIVEQETQPSFITVTGINVGADPTKFSVSASDAAILAPNTPLRLDAASNTVLYISDVTGTTVTATAADGSAVALTVGAMPVIGARAFEEQSSAPGATTWQPALRSGYTQTYRFAWGNSRWMRLVKTFISETQIVRDRNTAMMEVKRTVERGIIFNPMLKVAGPPTRYFAGGLYDQNSLNVYDVAGNGNEDGVLSYDLLEDFFTALKWSGNELWALSSPEVASVIRKLAWNKSNADSFVGLSNGTTLGVPWTKLQVGNKRVTFFESNHMVGNFQTDLQVIDKRNINIVTTTDQDSGKPQWMLLDTNAKTPGLDGDLNVLTVDFGLEMRNRQSHALIRHILAAGR